MRLSSVRVVSLSFVILSMLSANAAIAQVDSSQASTRAEINGDTNVDQAVRQPQTKVTISKETTYITEPLRPDGYPDYIRHLDEKLSRGVTPDNNAAVALVRALGPRELSGNHAAEFYKRLGIEPLPEKWDYLVDWMTFSARFSAKDWPAVPPGDNRDVKEYFQ